MKVVTKYVSVLGREFDTPAAAQIDEDRLPSIIATHEADLARMIVGNEFAGKVLTEETRQETRSLWERSIAGYKLKWAQVQAQRM